MTMIEPGWPLAAQRVAAFTTTRGDRTDAALGVLPAQPCWRRQVHGSRVIDLADWRPGVEADAAWSDRPGEVVVIQTADCLPILMADRNATLVAGIHGG